MFAIVNNKFLFALYSNENFCTSEMILRVYVYSKFSFSIIVRLKYARISSEYLKNR